MSDLAQDPDQTLQPRTDNVEFRSSAQPANDGLNLQAPTGNASQAHAETTLQPQDGAGDVASGNSKARDAQELQAPGGNNDKSNTSDPAQDPGLTLQPEKSNPSGTKDAGHDQNTATTLQPGEDDSAGNAAQAADSGDTSKSKNPLKKVGEFFKKEAGRQTEGPPPGPST